MELRPLGDTGLRVSPLGLGTVKLGRNQGVRYPRPFALPSDRDAAALLELARSLGINLLDTAPAYGDSEARLGRLLPGRREDWVIATKVGEEFDGGASRFDFSAAAVRASVERSLGRLRSDWLDIVLIHSDGNDLEILHATGALEALRELQSRGWVRAVGMSTKTLAGGLAAVAACDLVMVTLNPLHREELPVIAAARAAGKGVLIKKGLASGHLHRLEGADPVAAALGMIFAQPGVGSVIVGTLDPDHLRANIAAAERALASGS
ncbi:MAG: aldo/keto reductase [Pseudomonadota bacterium]|nr:aldo/keto reductase [Pseudomonadota bacterium]